MGGRSPFVGLTPGSDPPEGSDARWAVYIDVQGTASTISTDPALFYRRLDALLDGIIRIGTRVARDGGLYVHQTGGDGFLIVPGPAVVGPGLPVAIAVVLMRRVLQGFGVAKAGVSVGDFADQGRRLPSLEQVARGEGGSFRLGEGNLYPFLCMGTALVRAHALGECEPRGARVAVDRSMISSLPAGLIVSREWPDRIIVDWIHSSTPEIDQVVSEGEFQLPSAPVLENSLRGYVRSVGQLGESDWGKNTLRLNGCA